MKDKIGLRGHVTVRLLDSEGNVKMYPRSFLRRLLRLPGRKMESCRHNIVTRQGDALIADAMLDIPQRTKVGTGTGFMQVGTGWTGTNTKYRTRCLFEVGIPHVLDPGFPQLIAEWGTTGDTKLKYRTTFEAGTLSAIGINEVALLNGSDSSAACLAYAQVSPAVNVTSTDTLQIEWEITMLGQ